MGDDLAGAVFFEGGDDVLIEVVVSERVGHVRAEGGIALEEAGGHVCRNDDLGSTRRSCEFGVVSSGSRNGKVYILFPTFERLFQPSDLAAGVGASVVGAVVEVRIEEHGDETFLQDVSVKAAPGRELPPSRGIPDQILPPTLLEKVRVKGVVLGKEARRAGVVVAHDR